MKRFYFIIMLVLASLSVMADNNVTVTYNGSAATVAVDDNIAQYVTVAQNGAHVSITQSAEVNDAIGEITYTLSGTSNDGEFYMAGSYKATIELNGLTLTNTTPVYSGAAVHVQNGKRINVKVVTGTTNTLTDAASGSQKGCLYVKGHAEFKQKGTLNIVGNLKHGIKAGEYITVKNATINITSAAGDGISCNQYFLMESGTITINGTDDDGIQVDLDGTTSTGMTNDHEEEDSGNVYISGGTITIHSDAIAAKGIKCAGDAYISDNPTINITTTGKGEWDETDLETNAACGLSADGDINISGGTITLSATGSGGKGMKCDNVLNISGGDITVSTTGGLYYNNGTTENTNYTSNTDWVDNSYYSAAKGIKAGYKDESGSTTICYGGINISGGKVHVTTTGRNAEGIESKNYLNVTGGETTIDAYDDGINAAQDLYITDGYLYARSSNNDGIDANGNVVIEGGLIYAIGSQSPEVAIDANSEENKKFYFNGGVLITVGGLESGSNLSQTCYQSSSVSSNTWYSLTYGSNVVAFLTPTISSGGSGGGPDGGSSSSKLVVSAPSTPTLKSGVTVSSGTAVFYGPKCYVDATVSGGSNVSLSQYTSGGGGFNPGGGGSTGPFTITASANPTAGGTVTGAGSYTGYTLCTLTATANTGYTFNNWTRNGSVSSTSSTYSFYVSEAASCVANFTLNTYDVAVKAYPEEGGTVTGGGTYGYGTTATMTAEANDGYVFVNWTENGNVVSTDASYSVAVTEAHTLIANFEAVSNIVVSPVTLTQGWNWWSTCVETPAATLLTDFENALDGNGIKIQSQTSGYVEYGNGAWTGALFGINVKQMYKVRTSSACEVALPGNPVDPANCSITIRKGNNWIGFPLTEETDINVALANLNAATNDIIKYLDYFSTFYGNGWYGTLNNLEPGKGYIYKSTATGSKTFTYNTGRGTVRDNVTSEGNHWTVERGRYADNMNIIATVELDGVQQASSDLEVAAFIGGECRGSVKLIYVEPLNQHFAFLTIGGNDGETVSFKALSNGNVVDLQETVTIHLDEVVGTMTAPYVLHNGSAELSLFPNPANKGEHLQMATNADLSGATVEIFNALGTRVRIETLSQSRELEGLNAAGIYTVKITDQKGKVRYGKLVVR